MKKQRSGFTLVELLIVIVVIAILAAISVVAYNGIQSRARDTIRKNDAATIAKLMTLYATENGPIYQSSGCGWAGQGSGWFNHQGSLNYPRSVMNCIKDSGATGQTLADPSGTTACTTGGRDCYAYMVGTCEQSSQIVTYVYVNLESKPRTTTAADGACYDNYDSTFGMDHLVKVTY